MRWLTTSENWVREDSNNHNSVAAAANLLAMIGVPFAKRQLRTRIRTHPQFPSLPTLIDSLEEAGLNVQAVSGETDELADVALPAIAHLREGEDGRFVVLTKVGAGSLRYLDPRLGWVESSHTDFAKVWSGVLLLAAAPDDAEHSEARAARRAERLDGLRIALLLGIGGLALVSLALYALLTVPSAFQPLWPMLVTVKAAGLAVSGLLVAFDSGRPASMVRRLCPAGRVADCASVLASPAARLGGWIPMADLGVLYFAGGLLALAGARLTGDYATALGLLTALLPLTLAYSVFSIGYQALALHKWCWLCLQVMGLFWVEALLIGFASPLPLSFWLAGPPLAGWAFFAASFVLPGVAWGLLMPLIKRGVGAQQQADELLRHRRNPILLHHALQQQMPVAIGRIEPEIQFGAESAPLQLTLVSHPLCSACREVHLQIEKLVAESAGQILCTVRMGYRATDPGRGIAQRVIGIALADGGLVAAQALSAWYANPAQGEARWLDRFPLVHSAQMSRIDEVFEAHRAWVASAHLDGIPAIFLDGKALPREFSLNDLKGFLRSSEAGYAA